MKIMNVDTCIHALKDLVDIVDTPGGHILVCMMVGLLGAIAAIFGYMEVGKEMMAFLATMAYAMRGTVKANGKDKPQAPEPPPSAQAAATQNQNLLSKGQ